MNGQLLESENFDDDDLLLDFVALIVDVVTDVVQLPMMQHLLMLADLNSYDLVLDW